MDASQIVLTAEGRQKLVEELAWREGDYAKEIVEDIKEARAFGDLSENSEYDAAKDKQAQNAARIAEIQAILANAQVAATTGDLTVSIGSTVSLIDPNGEVMEVTLVGTTETNSLEATHADCYCGELEAMLKEKGYLADLMPYEDDLS